MRRLGVLLMAGLVAGTVFLAATAAARKKTRKKPPSGPVCTIQNAGGEPSTSALGGWAYDVSFRCPFALHSFSVQMNKSLLSGVDKFGLAVPYAYARLGTGKQANFACKDTSTKSVTCTVSPALPARILIVDGFDSSTVCRNNNAGKLKATLAVNGRTTRVAFINIDKTSNNGSLVGGCG